MSVPHLMNDEFRECAPGGPCGTKSSFVQSVFLGGAVFQLELLGTVFQPELLGTCSPWKLTRFLTGW